LDAVASPSGTEARLLHLGPNRQRTIQMASFNVLNMLRKELIKKFKNRWILTKYLRICTPVSECTQNKKKI